MQLLRRSFSWCILLIAFVATVGCGDAASNANKDLKPVDPNAPKPVGAAGAGAGGGAKGGADAGAAPVK